MSDTRLPSVPFELGGKTYQLRCNFNVLADVVEESNGTLPDPFDKKTRLKLCRSFLAAMLNDYADEMGWEERFTPRGLGRRLGADIATVAIPVMDLVIRSLFTESKADKNAGEKAAGDEPPKN